jgi:hypothetical protein
MAEAEPDLHVPAAIYNCCEKYYEGMKMSDFTSKKMRLIIKQKNRV